MYIVHVHVQHSVYWEMVIGHTSMACKTNKEAQSRYSNLSVKLVAK